MSRIIRWGFIGCGDVVERKSFPSVQSTTSAEVVAVFGRNPSKVEAFAKQQGIRKWYTDVSDFLSDQDIEAVYVATPPDSHCEYTQLAAAARKHVLCEKPMALSVDEAEKMIQVCKANGVHLMVAYYRRFYPQILEMKRQILSGKLGKCVQARLHLAMPFAGQPSENWRYDPSISGGGLLLDIGSHRLDALIYLLGDVAQLSAVVVKHNDNLVEDSVVAILHFRNDCLADVSVDGVSANGIDTLEIYGTAGCALANPLEAFRLSILREGKEEVKEFPAPVRTHKAVFEHFAKVVCGEKESLSSGEDAIKTTEVIEAIFNSSDQGKAVACRH